MAIHFPPETRWTETQTQAAAATAAAASWWPTAAAATGRAAAAASRTDSLDFTFSCLYTQTMTDSI